ncbi:MAG: YceD family protein [Casimicrobiaceae bacterium]
MKRDKDGRAGTRFDALKLADAGGVLGGEVNPARLPRLADRVVAEADAPSIAWRVVGGHDALGHPALTLSLDGAAFMTCQRCLRPFAVPVAQETVLLLARNERDLVHLDADEPEVVLAGAPLDPLALVEDELLLSLPFAPRHTDAECDASSPASVVAATSEKPFAQLAELKARRQSKN